MAKVALEFLSMYYDCTYVSVKVNRGHGMQSVGWVTVSVQTKATTNANNLFLRSFK